MLVIAPVVGTETAFAAEQCENMEVDAEATAQGTIFVSCMQASARILSQQH